MATPTPNIGLLKPLPGETFDLNQYNSNLDKTDQNVQVYGALQPITLNSLYSNQSGYRPLSARKWGGRVFIEGMCGNVGIITFTAGTVYTLGTLPAGFAPSANNAVRFSENWGGGQPLWWGVDSSGNITFTLFNTVTNAPAASVFMQFNGSYDQ